VEKIKIRPLEVERMHQYSSVVFPSSLIGRSEKYIQHPPISRQSNVMPDTNGIFKIRGKCLGVGLLPEFIVLLSGRPRRYLTCRMIIKDTSSEILRSLAHTSSGKGLAKCACARYLPR